MKRILVIATSRKTRGGITSVIKAHETGKQWEKYHCHWIQTHRDGSDLRKLLYLSFAWLDYLARLPFYDAVHVHFSLWTTARRKRPFVAVAKFFGKKVIIHLHCGSQIHSIWNENYDYLFAAADACIMLSKNLKSMVEEHTGKSAKYHVLYNPCPEVSRTNIPVKKNRILFSGTLYEEKGYLDLVRAFALIAHRHQDWKVVFAGNGEIEKGEALARQLGISNQIEFIGWVNGQAKDEAFQKASVFCLPSYAEGFPMAVLDAWAYGLPCVVTPVGGIPELVEDGKQGLVFPAGDVEKLAAALERMIDEPELRRSIVENTDKMVYGILSVQSINHQLEKIYDSLLAENNHIQELFLATLRSSVSRQDENLHVDGNQFKPLFTQAMRQSVLGFTFEGLKKNNIGIPQPLEDRWSLYVDVIRQKEGQSARQCAEVYNMFAADGVQCVILKGSAIARYYGSMASLRQFGDIDVWVQNNMSIKQLVDYIKPRCSSYEAKRSHVKAPLFQTNVVECHPTPSILRCPWNNRRLQKWFASHRESILDPNLGFPVMPPSFDAVFLLVHIYHHLLFEGVGLRQYMDYYMLLRSQKFSPAQKADAMAALDSFGMGKCVRGVMWVLGHVFALEEEYMLCTPDAEVGRMILRETLVGGNFGRFDSRHKNLKSSNLLLRGWASIKKRFPLFALGPWEIIFSPFWSVWQAAWRYSHGYMKKMEMPKTNDRTIF